MAAMEELETLLQSLQTLKPPGITKPKIEAINAKCVENVQFDAAIVQKIVQQFTNSPATHKLGVLYVVDSVTRQWTEKAKLAGQAISKNAAPGTFASGVQKMTDALPTLMADIIKSAPENHKEKITKLIDIWERGLTFPLAMLVGFKRQLSQPQKNANTPPGSPPNGHNAGYLSNGQTNQQPVAPQVPIAPPQDTGALLAALAGFGQQQQQQQQQQQHIAQPSAMPAAPPALPFLQNPIAAPLPPPGFVPPPLPTATGQPVMPPSTATVNDWAGQILQAITLGSIAPEQGLQVLNALAAASNGGSALPIPPQPPIVSQVQPGVQNGTQQHQYEQDNSRFRDRSRSPDYRGAGSGNGRHRSPNRRSPPNRRDSPTYAAYDPNAGADGNSSNRPERGERGRGRNKNRKGTNDRNDYRQRTPPGQRRQASPPGKAPQNSGQSKYLEWDHSLPRDNIKVLSRTLFVGGAAGTEGEIRNIFSRFGRVQTCIVNQDKRHAFVKMLTRPDAVAAKEGMDNAHDPLALAKARQTRWGVGFGPRDCSDYATGISVIPINRLTDADRKWALTAENGGTGGRPLEGGMVMEEPDIEIGAGVSSKAISKRVPTDSGRGGRGGFGGRGGGFRKQDRPPVNDNRHISPRPEQAVAVPPAVPGFGFQLPGF